MMDLNKLIANAHLEQAARKARNALELKQVENLIEEYYDDGANEWERKFLKSVLTRLQASDTNTLTKPQQSILDNLPGDIQQRLERHDR